MGRPAARRRGTPLPASLAIDSVTQAQTKRYTTPFGAPRGASTTWTDDKQFLNKPADPTTGLTHIGAREYDPTTARFLSVGPLLETDKPQTLNGYTYGANNPVALSDPGGQGLGCGGNFEEGCGDGNQTHGDGSLSHDGNPTGGGTAHVGQESKAVPPTVQKMARSGRCRAPVAISRSTREKPHG